MINDLIQRLTSMWGDLDPIDEWRKDIVDAIDALEAQAREIEALRADAKRLDWCMERLFDPDRGYLTTDMGCGCCGDGLRFKGLDGRSAIDAAIEAGKAVTP